MRVTARTERYRAVQFEYPQEPRNVYTVKEADELPAKLAAELVRQHHERKPCSDCSDLSAETAIAFEFDATATPIMSPAYVEQCGSCGRVARIAVKRP